MVTEMRFDQPAQSTISPFERRGLEGCAPVESTGALVAIDYWVLQACSQKPHAIEYDQQ